MTGLIVFLSSTKEDVLPSLTASFNHHSPNTHSEASIYIKLFKNDSSMSWGWGLLSLWTEWLVEDIREEEKVQAVKASPTLAYKIERECLGQSSVTNEEPERHRWEGTPWSSFSSVNHRLNSVLHALYMWSQSILIITLVSIQNIPVSPMKKWRFQKQIRGWHFTHMFLVYWCSIIARVLLFDLYLFYLEERKLTAVPASKSQWFLTSKNVFLTYPVISVEVSGEPTVFLVPKDIGLGLVVFCYGPSAWSQKKQEGTRRTSGKAFMGQDSERSTWFLPYFIGRNSVM